MSRGLSVEGGGGGTFDGGTLARCLQASFVTPPGRRDPPAQCRSAEWLQEPVCRRYARDGLPFTSMSEARQ